MRRGVVSLVAATYGLAALCVAPIARALGPLDIEAGLKAGGGTGPLSGEPNALGFGLGGRAGASFAGYYGGANVVYYFGQSGTVENLSVSEHALLYGVEVGYGLTFLDLLTLRGLLGVGNFTLSYTGVSNISSLYLEPNLTALVSLGLFYVGADAGALLLPALSDPGHPSASLVAAFTGHGQLGIKF